MVRKNLRIALGIGMLSACSFLFWAPRAGAQVAAAGAITGTVTDPSGGVIPGAEVTITNVATQQSRVAKTNAAGFYDEESLLASTYAVTIKKEGFKAFVSQGVRLDAGARVAVNAVLELGTTVNEVNVTASAVRVETESGDSSGVIGSEQISQFALNGRNFMTLAMLVPGVNSTAGARELQGGGLTSGSVVSVNGLGVDFTQFEMDGTYNMNTGNNSNVNVTSPIDTISEFRILKDNYSAKYGLGGSGIVMLETKSGTKLFHGAAYDYLRNDKLDASNFFSGGQKTPLKQNIFGFALSGPAYIPGKYNVDRKKTFFFVSEEWRRRHTGLTLRGAMIPQTMRNGDFTNSPTLGSGGLKFDSVATNIMAQLHPGVNCRPDSSHLDRTCYDQNAVNIMNRYWPLPNNPAGGFLNYLNNGVDIQNQRSDTYRIDHYFNQKLSLMGRISYETVLDTPPAMTWSPNPAPTMGQIIKQTAFNNLLRFTSNISPTTINQFTFAQTHDKPRLSTINQDLPSDVKIKLPFGDIDQDHRVPSISIAGGWAGLNTFVLPTIASDGTLTFSDDFSKVKSSHVIQAGAMFLFGIKRQNLFANTNGAFSFNGVHSNDPVADYLLGLNASFLQDLYGPEGYYRYRQFEAYIQDDWKVNRRLTLNLGLREAYYTSDKIGNLPWSDFDPRKWDPAKAPFVQSNGLFVQDANGNPLTQTGAVADLLNGVVIAGQNGVPAGVFNTSPQWAPRAGFAWDIFGNGKTSLRGGYGIGYMRTAWGNFLNVGNPPYGGSITLLNGTLTDPALSQNAPKGPSVFWWVGPPGANYKPPRLQTWSLTLQRELLPNGVLSLAYVGSGGRHIPGAEDYNFPSPVSAPSVANPDCLSAGQTAPPSGFNFDPCINAGVASPNATRPFLGWSGINTRGLDAGGGTYLGTSNYHSFQAGFQYTAGRGLTLTAAYTWGKSLSDVAGRGIAGGNEGAGAQNPRNFKGEYGPPGFDRTNIFTSGYIYDIPFLKGRADFAGKALGGWTFSGLTVIESGFAFDPAVVGATGLASRPNCVANVSGPKTLTQWFNTAAFRVPAYGFFGNCGTGLIRGPGENTWNWALYKSFPIKEKLKLQFRSEFFNIWNHPSFDNLSTALGAGNFGNVTSALDPRIVEFALRLDF